jgi:hypothetical protein
MPVRVHNPDQYMASLRQIIAQGCGIYQYYYVPKAVSQESMASVKNDG